jgi:hypothetical protein
MTTRVRAHDFVIVEGRVLQRSSENLILSQDKISRSIPIESIEAIWVRHGSIGNGAIWGATGFGVIGIVIGLTINGLCHNLDESENPEGCPEYIAYGAAIGATGGAVFGAAIGAATIRWQQVYP